MHNNIDATRKGHWNLLRFLVLYLNASPECLRVTLQVPSMSIRGFLGICCVAFSNHEV